MINSEFTLADPLKEVYHSSDSLLEIFLYPEKKAAIHRIAALFRHIIYFHYFFFFLRFTAAITACNTIKKQSSADSVILTHQLDNVP